MRRSWNRQRIQAPGGEIGDGFGDLISAACRGDEEAITELYLRYNPRLSAYVKSVSSFDSDDVCSDVWLSLCRVLPDFKGDESGFRGMLFTIARNKVKDRARRRSESELRYSPEDIDIMFLKDHADPAEVIVDAEQARSVLSRLSHVLPKAEAEVLRLSVLGELSSEEVGRILKKSPNTVRVLRHKALKRLSEILEEPADADVRVKPARKEKLTIRPPETFR